MPLEVKIEKKLGNFFLNMEIKSDSRRIGILGASGCGKSMTLKCIAGIETPDRGRICLDGRCLFDSGERINRKPQERRLGYLFQNYALFPTMTVAQNVAAGLKGSKAEKNARVREMIDRFQLEGLEGRLPGELSGGQQQRAALARIMAYEPELIMLDEPFSALDVYLKEQLQQEMREMLADYEGTVILVSHSRDEIYQFSDYLVVMDQGAPARWGDTCEIFANPGNRVAAGLTGCKNISAARKTGEYQVYAQDWNLTLTTGEMVPDTLRYVGIRAHDLEPLWDERQVCEAGNGFGNEAGNESGTEYGAMPGAETGAEPGEAGRANCLPCRITAVSEAPFETVYLADCPGGTKQIWWKVAKNRLDAGRMDKMPEYLYLPPGRLLLLS